MLIVPPLFHQCYAVWLNNVNAFAEDLVAVYNQTKKKAAVRQELPVDKVG